MGLMNTVFGKSNPELHEVMAEMAVAKPPLRSGRLQTKPADPKGNAYLAEYAALAKTLGVMPPDLAVESFKAFMVAHDLPIYSLLEVIAYMDNKAAKESPHKSGWYWRALREKDHMRGMTFGTKAERHHNGRDYEQIKPASDYYNGSEHVWEVGNNREIRHKAHAEIYDRTIPLHALQRIALIEKEHKGPVAFLVSDYALAPAIPHPDPFLMAVVQNPNVALGEGRFVIDFWDEPGFGIEQMLK